MLNAAMTGQMHLKSELDVVVTALPCPHVYGNFVFNGALMYGLTLVLHPRFDAVEILSSIETHRATMFEGVPTMYMYMLAHRDFESFDLSSLTRCTVGGQTMPTVKMEEVVRRFGCPLVMEGYYGNEQATREAIEPNGWLHSGDIASMDEDGAIFIVDRKKDMINTAGFKVFPAEVERVVAQHPSVAMVAVGSQPDDMKGEIARRTSC